MSIVSNLRYASSFSVSKENDLDSNASSIDTDMEDNISQDAPHRYDHLSSATPVASSVMILPRPIDDDLHAVSLNDNDDYLANNLEHIHLLHSNVSIDPNLNHHNTTLDNANPISNDLSDYRPEPILQYYRSSSSEVPIVNKSPSMTTPISSNPPAGTNFDPNSEITFLCDLITPPTNTTILRQSVESSQLLNQHPNFFNEHWS